MIVGVTCGGPDLYARVRAALEAGIDRVIVRENALPAHIDSLAAVWPDRLVLHTRMPGAVELAERLPVSLHHASDVVPGVSRIPFSVSAHSAAEVQQALARGAVWALLSPIWRSPSKPADRRPPLGVGVLHVRGAVALGGVTLERVPLCRAAGALGAAGMGGIFGARDVAEAVAEWRRAWDRASAPRGQNDQTSSS